MAEDKKKSTIPAPKRRDSGVTDSPIPAAIADAALVSPEVQEDLRQAARRNIEEERKKKAEDQFMKDVLREERARMNLNPNGESMVDIQINLAPHSEYIEINGDMRFYHGRSYKVPQNMAGSLNEIMARGWQHENTLRGDSSRESRRRMEHRV